MGDFFSLSHSRALPIYHSLALEEAISRHFVEFGYLGGIRFWTSKTCIVLGISENPYTNLNAKAIEEFIKYHPQAPVSIARRASGGGTVVQTETENLNFSFFANLDVRKDLYPVQDSYQAFLGIVVDSLKPLGIEARWKGKSDLVLASGEHSLKFSGNAQFRKKNCIVHHGTLILNAELIQKAEQLLHHPPEEPDYRKGRSHGNFLTALPPNFSRLKWEKSVTSQWLEFLGFQDNKLQKDQLERKFWKQVLLTKQELLTKYNSIGFILNKEIP